MSYNSFCVPCMHPFVLLTFSTSPFLLVEAYANAHVLGVNILSIFITSRGLSIWTALVSRDTTEGSVFRRKPLYHQQKLPGMIQGVSRVNPPFLFLIQVKNCFTRVVDRRKVDIRSLYIAWFGNCFLINWSSNIIIACLIETIVMNRWALFFQCSW